MALFDTQLIHAGEEPDPLTGAIAVPIYQTSTFARASLRTDQPYIYSRISNPTRKALERKLAILENGKFALAYSSGMAAIDAVFHLLRPKDHVIACKPLYGGTYRLLTQVYNNYQISCSFVDGTDPKNFEEAITPQTKLIWIESPTNPLLTLVDIKAVASIAKRYGCWLAVDNTFASPYLQQPLLLGADIVVHSTTKYLGGHSDLIGGAVIVSSKRLYDQLAFYQKSIGAVPGPLDVFLVLRGIKTLAVRMDKHCFNAIKIAEFLSSHPKVKKVYYPGLPTHPQYELAKKQMRNFGGMVSFEIKGNRKDAEKLVTSTKIFTLAESLGGVESLIGQPANMSHSSLSNKEKKEWGISEQLIRLSVGIENVEDLINDLKNALNQVPLRRLNKK